ncbi:DDE-type integrase/transposase/recombinase, partial [Agrobacterium sp. MCAB5]|uniref:DDE-type integrase/transposase/recombinase n=1 Tax=Agrobacterium sp. MCAB5 TaxID=3233042 RepID=UPI003F8FC6B9
GRKFWLWRAIDANGDVLDILVQARRNSRAARRFFSRLVRQFGQPRVVVTLTPSGEGRAALEQDYARMLEDGLLLDKAETFEELLARCAKIQDKANAVG